MSDTERPEAEENFGLFLSPSGSAAQGGYLVPMKGLNVGPGEPGPEDEWHVPPAESEGSAGETVPTAGPVDPTPPQSR